MLTIVSIAMWVAYAAWAVFITRKVFALKSDFESYIGVMNFIEDLKSKGWKVEKLEFTVDQGDGGPARVQVYENGIPVDLPEKTG